MSANESGQLCCDITKVTFGSVILLEIDLAARLCEAGEWVFLQDSTLVLQACSREKLEKKYLVVCTYK